MKNKALVLGLAFSLLVYSANLVAKERRGAELVVQKTDGQTAKGELIAVKPASLLLLDPQTGADVSIDIGEIRVIKIIKESKVLAWAGIGFLVSSVSLCGLWWATDPEGFTDPEGGGPLVVAAFFGLPGLLLGALVGGILSEDKTIPVEGKSDSEIKEILEKLRGQARVPDAQ